MGALRSGSGFRAVRDYRVIIWERFAGILEDARFCIENRSTLFAHFCRFRHDEPENGANLARSSHVRLKHARSKLLGLAAVIQARIGRWTRVRAAGSVCSFSRG